MRPAERRGNSWIMHQRSLSNDASAVTHEAVKHAGTQEKIPSGMKPWSYCVTFFRLRFITRNVFLCHSLMLRPFSELNLFTASFLLSLMSSWANKATMSGLRSPRRHQSRGNLHMLSGKWRQRDLTFPTCVQTESFTRKGRVKWFTGILSDVFSACIIHSRKDTSPASSKQPLAV